MSDDASLNLEHSRLLRSKFSDVALDESSFRDVGLRKAVFENVALTGATFRNACFGDVSIDDANLEGMKINGVLVSELFRTFEQTKR